jgi:uncharacterized membrane protein
MRDLMLFFHLAAAIVWMGGMVFMVAALRAPAHALLQPPQRLPLMAAVLSRFLLIAGVSVAVLLATGLALMLSGGAGVPPGWKAMAGIGVVMMLIYGHIVAAPLRGLKRAVAAQDWPAGGKRMAQITLLAKINLALGWIAIAAVVLWR